MNPNQIIFLDDLFKLGREMIIDLEISGEIPACELGEVQPIMQNWPQHLIGKAAVIFVKAFLRQVGDYVFDILVSNQPRFQLIPGRDLTAPTQPDIAVVVERWPQCNFEPASTLGAVTRNRNAVRNDYESCQYRSPPPATAIASLLRAPRGASGVKRISHF